MSGVDRPSGRREVLHRHQQRRAVLSPYYGKAEGFPRIVDHVRLTFERLREHCGLRERYVYPVFREGDELAEDSDWSQSVVTSADPALDAGRPELDAAVEALRKRARKPRWRWLPTAGGADDLVYSFRMWLAAPRRVRLLCAPRVMPGLPEHEDGPPSSSEVRQARDYLARNPPRHTVTRDDQGVLVDPLADVGRALFQRGVLRWNWTEIAKGLRGITPEAAGDRVRYYAELHGLDTSTVGPGRPEITEPPPHLV